MKPFIFSLMIIAFMVVLVLFNAFYIKKTMDSLSREVLKISTAEDSDSLEELWKRNKLLISISASHKEIDKIEEQLKVMKIRLENQDFTGFKVAQALLVSYIEQIKCHEAVTIDNII